MILLIDNYDSFTYMLADYFQQLGAIVRVITHDAYTIEEISEFNFSHLVISPGPNSPNEAGISLAAIQHFKDQVPILGICLGHQCLAQAFGGIVIPSPQILHGKTSLLQHRNSGLFKNLPNPLQVMRYHSLAVSVKELPDCFGVDAWADDTIMAISHNDYPLFGLQFHPESALTEHGLTLIGQFIQHGHL